MQGYKTDKPSWLVGILEDSAFGRKIVVKYYIVALKASVTSWPTVDLSSNISAA